MSSQKVTVSCRIKYRNTNGTYNFYGAHYRLIGVTGNVISSGKTDRNGITDTTAKAYEGTKIYVELKNIATGKWESPNPLKRQAFIARKNTPRYSIIVTNLYFKMKLTSTNSVPLEWRYYMIFKDREGRSFNRSGSFNDKGESAYISYNTINPKNHKEIFINKSKSYKLNVEVKLIPPKLKMIIPTVWLRLIPVGADKSFRTHKIAVTTDTTKELTKESLTKLKDMAEYRKVLLDIDLQSGASYTIERAQKGYLYDKDLAETTKITFQNNESRQIYVPKKYNGELLLKKNGKNIATLSLAALDPNNRNTPIIFCLSNKTSGSSRKNKLSIEHLSNTEAIVWHFETKHDIAEGNYVIKRNDMTNNEFEVMKNVTRTLLASLAFDGVALPTAVEMRTALKNNNRQFIFDALKRLKIGKDSKDILKFTIKKSKTGKTLIIFKGYSGLRSFLTATTYSTNNMKVGIVSTAADIKTASRAGGLSTAGLMTAKTAARGLPGFGFALVATFDIAEFMLSDDPLNNWSDLYVTLGIDAVKTVIATAAGLIVGAIIVGSGIGIAVVAGGIAAAVLTSFALEAGDRKYNVTQKAQNMVNYLESSNMKYLEANKSL
ncbi:hypothetical protein [Psychrobacter celer]|uniref:hypothetical protein n=1 Tax=Psychrobacter celer TaxID=306572 RepID=UPI003FD63920